MWFSAPSRLALSLYRHTVPDRTVVKVELEITFNPARYKDTSKVNNMGGHGAAS